MSASAAPSRRLSVENALPLMLVFVPLAGAAALLHWGALAVFTCAALAVVPLAGLMGQATEELSERLGAGMGGFLNATFGNAAELILGVVALHRGLYGVVKASLTGSIIGNALLVLGLSLLVGGIGRERQTFNRSAAAVSSTLLALAALGLVVPGAYHTILDQAVHTGAVRPLGAQSLERHLSLLISLVLFATYLLSLLFSLRTHRHLYEGSRSSHAAGASHGRPTLRPVLTLVAATVMVAAMSELLVGAVEETSRILGLTQVFVGVVVVAVVGNAAEHSTAVLMALRNRMDLTFHIAIGSGIQIALFVAPVMVFLSYFMPHGPMELRFTPMEVLAVLAAVGSVHLVAQDGESNWLEGAMLLSVYLVLALAFYFLP